MSVESGRGFSLSTGADVVGRSRFGERVWRDNGCGCLKWGLVGVDRRRERVGSGA